MPYFEARVPRGREAERFNTAVYRFFELKASGLVDHPAMIRTEPDGDHERKRVLLWSDDAVDEFGRFWQAFTGPVHDPNPMRLRA